MKRFEIKKVKAKPLFIGSLTAEPISICNKITYYLDENIAKQPRSLNGDNLDENLNNQREISISSREIAFSGYEIFKDYSDFLFRCYQDYCEQWPFLLNFKQTLEANTFNIRRYNQGQFFEGMDAERDLENLRQFFVFITFLNDVERGGSIHFRHYDLEIKPQKGLTLIWPADWTHAHRGNMIEIGTKYIITGWLDLGSNPKRSK